MSNSSIGSLIFFFLGTGIKGGILGVLWNSFVVPTFKLPEIDPVSFIGIMFLFSLFMPYPAIKDKFDFEKEMNSQFFYPGCVFVAVTIIKIWLLK